MRDFPDQRRPLLYDFVYQDIQIAAGCAVIVDCGAQAVPTLHRGVGYCGDASGSLQPHPGTPMPSGGGHIINAADGQKAARVDRLGNPLYCR